MLPIMRRVKSGTNLQRRRQACETAKGGGAVLRLDVLRRMRRAGGLVEEQRLVRLRLAQITDHLDGVIGQGVGKVEGSVRRTSRSPGFRTPAGRGTTGSFRRRGSPRARPATP